MRRFVLLALVSLLIVPLLAANPAVAQDKLQVVASFSILADVAANVAGDAADVHALMPVGADPHGFAPTPQDMVALADAEVVFLVGAGFEESLDSAIANAASDMTLVEASACVDILPFGFSAEQPTAASEAPTVTTPAVESAAENAAQAELATLCAAHHAELATLLGTSPAEVTPDASLGMLYTLECTHDEHDAAEETEQEHAAGSCDPHVWLAPYNGMYWAMLIRDTLARLDPANADVYAANAAAYLASLHVLAHDELTPLMATVPEANRKLVTAHSAFGYFAHAYGFALVGVIIPGGSTLAEPSAAEIAGLIDLIRTEDVPALFAETTANPTLAEQVAAETGAQFYTLYTGTLSAADGPAATYIDYLRYNARTIAAALGGSASE